MIIVPETYGAVGDGVTDDALSFKTMGILLRSKPLEQHIIECEPGAVYLNSHQEWLSGVLNFVIEGRDSVFTMPLGSTVASLNRFYGQQSPFAPFDLSDPDNMRQTEGPHTGVRIETVGAGKLQLQLTPEGLADAVDGRLRLGICMVYAGTKQDQGWPPNPAVWEWNEVFGFDLVAGTVDLKTETVFEYRSDGITSRQVPGSNETRSWGPARIVCFEGVGPSGGAHYYQRLAVFRDLTFRPVDSKNVSSPTGLDIRFERCVFDFSASTSSGHGSNVSLTRRSVHHGCNWIANANGGTNPIEVDKMVGIYRNIDCFASKITQASGVQTLIVDGSEFSEAALDLSADWIDIRNAKIVSNSGAMVNASGRYPSGGGVVANCVGRARNAAPQISVGIAGLRPQYTFEVEQIGPNGELIWSLDGPQQQFPATMTAKGGQIFVSNDGSNAGRAIRSVDLGDGLAGLICNFQTPPQVGDMFYFTFHRGPTEDGGNNVVNAGTLGRVNRVTGLQYYAHPNKVSLYGYGIEGVRVFGGATLKDRVYQSTLMGWFERIEIDVRRGYIGSASNSNDALSLVSAKPDEIPVDLGSIDLNTVGKRLIVPSDPSANVLLGDDLIDTSLICEFWASFHIGGVSGGSNWPDEGAEVLPVVGINVSVRGVTV